MNNCLGKPRMSASMYETGEGVTRWQVTVEGDALSVPDAQAQIAAACEAVLKDHAARVAFDKACGMPVSESAGGNDPVAV